MENYVKRDFPTGQVRKFLEPGPVVLVSSAFRDERTIMTMGWHMIMGFQPSLIGCYIWDANYSHDLVRKSRECVFNVPTSDMARTVVEIGNCSGRAGDKFERFNLTAVPGDKVKAPLIGECFANFECQLVETRLVKEYNLFIFEVVKAHVASRPKFPKTIHYRGNGQFMISGNTVANIGSISGRICWMTENCRGVPHCIHSSHRAF